MFVDRVIVSFSSGNGGNGSTSFRREKYIPKGGPNGGDGGKGGSVYLVSTDDNGSLLDLKHKRHIRADNGSNGMSSNKKGKNGEDTIIKIPAGTIVKSYPDEKIMFDFDKPGLELEIARGGRGGLGNAHFKSSVNQAPKFAQRGEKGETIKVVLELKLIAFAGLVGLPNAGKSTLISKISGAKPKIANYPFTTLYPNLGVVYKGYGSLVLADIPGIIEGAHKGEGMGIEFLKHIERNKLLVFMIDASGFDEPDLLKTFNMLREEVVAYSSVLKDKSYFVILNKIDLLNQDEQKLKLEEFTDYCDKNDIDYLKISALTGDNLMKVKEKLFYYYET